MFESLTTTSLLTMIPDWIEARRLRIRKRQKLVNTIYYHAKYAVEALKKLQKNNQSIQEKINNINSYTPYVPPSSADDLTYEHIIKVMEWLDEDGEESVSSYFHTQMSLHAIAQSFDQEFVRGWPQDRKLELWNMYEKCQEETLKYAQETVKVLEKHRLLKRANGRKPDTSTGLG